MSRSPVDGSGDGDLSFVFRGKAVPVTHGPHLSRDLVERALGCVPFRAWATRCEEETNDPDQEGTKKRIELRGVEIQSVDLFGSRVGFVKIKSDCTLVQERPDPDGGERSVVEESARLPGICLLRGDAVSILVALFCPRNEDGGGDGGEGTDCDEDNDIYCLLVDQPRVPIGRASCLELPAGMIDDGSVVGTAVTELQEECGITIDPDEVVDLTALAYSSTVPHEEKDVGGADHAPTSTRLGPDVVGLPPSPGGCDERVRYLYLERRVTPGELESMKDRLTGLREHGEVITLRVVPMRDVWRVSHDAKAIISLFLLERLRQEGKLPPAGCLARPLTASSVERSPPTCRQEDNDPHIRLHNGESIPQLAFGTYMVPNDAAGEAVVLNAIRAGYRHFDTASYYDNEAMLGRALRTSGVPRDSIVLSTKVWNDAVKAGRSAVRESVLESLQKLQTEYLDLVLIHWPVPNHFVDAYRELEVLVQEGKIKSIGLSNFTPQEYQELVKGGIAVHPVVNQFEVSPLMYRPNLVQYFNEHWISVAASKSLNRAACLDHPVIAAIAERHSVTPAQVILRWSVQKGLIVVSKTSSPARMKENRSLFHFTLSSDDMILLDSLTSPEAIRERDEVEATRKAGL